MTVHAPLTMTKEAFLAWVERREERYEFVGGRVIMMVRISRNHAQVTTNLVFALKPAERFDVAAEAFAVHIADSVRFPDVVVEPAQTDGHALEAKVPILIAEALSPGTLHIDFGDKRHEYLSLASLATYLVASPDEPRVWAWQRKEGAFPLEPEIIEGLDRRLVLPELGIEIPMPEIYRGIRV